MCDDTRLCPVCRERPAIVALEEGGEPRFCAECWATQRERCADPQPGEPPLATKLPILGHTLQTFANNQRLAAEVVVLALSGTAGDVSEARLWEVADVLLALLGHHVRQQIQVFMRNVTDHARFVADGQTPEDDPLDPAVEAEQQRYGDLCDQIRGLASAAIPDSAADLRPEHETLLAIVALCEGQPGSVCGEGRGER